MSDKPWPFTFADEDGSGSLALWCDHCEQSVKSNIEAGDPLCPLIDAACAHALRCTEI